MNRGGAWRLLLGTPRRDAAEPIPGERPYAGWLNGAWERVEASRRTRARQHASASAPRPWT